MENVRKLHNSAKIELISKLAKGKVLDVGSGRGGDLKKFQHCREVKHLTLIEPDLELMKESQKRFENIHFKIPVTFLQGDIHQSPLEQFDCICYNFSLHYIFHNEQLFHSSINEIHRRLKVGGKLFGCIPDSEKIIMCTPMTDKYGNIVTRKIDQSGYGRFGEKLYVKLESPYYEEDFKSEPIAYKDILITYLNDLGIRLIEWSPLLKDERVESISFLYSRFIFVKEY